MFRRLLGRSDLSHQECRKSTNGSNVETSRVQMEMTELLFSYSELKGQGYVKKGISTIVHYHPLALTPYL